MYYPFLSIFKIELLLIQCILIVHIIDQVKNELQ
jgi:hypothetical protein